MMQKTIIINTLGCSKNRVDSERLAKQIEAGGHRVLLEREILPHTQADILILNTCGFIQDAKEESIEAILGGVEAKKRGAVQRLLVFGCLSQRYAQTLAAEIPEVDGFWGANEPAMVLKAIGHAWQADVESERLLSTPAHYAYLKISEGCDRSCAFCAIPL
ncbi:MAG: 30S ribosomal protein S12 methylthiotransferase RimO, partial [Bacteroidales bacterium]|nr:30S ribosomal protein S12 methylthiotransferase RimO [Bacteroidales bacterium]